MEKVKSIPMKLYIYSEKNYQEREVTLSQLESEESIFHSTSIDRFWLNLDEEDPVLLKKICELFKIHQLVQEDILLKGQRPKVEEYPHHLFIVAKMVFIQNDVMKMEQISFILGENYLLTFGEIEGDVFDRVRQKLKKEGTEVRAKGVDFLLYQLLDALVEGYYRTLEVMGEKIDQMEEGILSRPGTEEMKAIRSLKKDLLYLHKYAWPLREISSYLSKDDPLFINKETSMYFFDIHSQLMEVIDTIETYRELLAGLMDLSLSSVSYRLNEVMKVLTIISTIFIPLSFIAGVYGMNFKYMPELESRYGYPLAWASMGAVALGMLYYFKKKKWF
ncbi:magnesium/cobalt transporter CorA [Proteiniclasticum ruminis]|uniref:Magnesium transport protein CorA n=1 Tax=Proteiniclasticum ruminis TaxID=398199 RepID=A0A1I4XRI6_9CLOT|nr:magnesium/cobalt transporter CorA [Proteiniclasticum ruminis]SFN27890.1 magnesium transporter [Proteiniclasticum ruminis]